MANRFFAWADRRQFISVRAGTLYVTLWMTYTSFDWAAHYAYAIVDKRQGLEIAAIIAAVTAPISALQAFIFKWYTESVPQQARNNNEPSTS